MSPVSAEFPSLLALTSTGFGKRSPVEDYRLTRRGASGVIGIKTGGRNGHVVAVLPVREEDEILVTTQNGITIRSPVQQIREMGRNTLGVIIIRIEEGDVVKAAVRLVAPGEAPTSASEGNGEGKGPSDPSSASGSPAAAPSAGPEPDDDGDEGSTPPDVPPKDEGT